MSSRIRHLLLGWIAVTVTGCVVGSHLALERLRTTFETDAQSTYQALAQGLREHETLLEALALLQPFATEAVVDEQRLGSLYPAVHKVLRHDPRTAWPDGLRAALADGEARSQRSARPALVRLDLAGGSYEVNGRALAPVDVPGETSRLQAAIGSIQATVLGSDPAQPGRASLAALSDRLAAGCDILYLACHGALLSFPGGGRRGCATSRRASASPSAWWRPR